MTTGTGLDGQLGFALETTAGTEVTVDKFVEFKSEGFEDDPSWIEPDTLRVGQQYKLASRLVHAREQVTGSFDVNHTTNLMGALWKAAIGSSITTPVLVGTTDAHEQVHQSGQLEQKPSLTVQLGRPEPVPTFESRAHTVRGCKVTGWEFAVADNEKATLNLELDGWQESTATALAAASYLSGVEEFNFIDATTLLLGATISGTDPLTFSGGTAPSGVVKSFTLTGEDGLNVERYGLGNAGIKREQLTNDFRVLSGSMEAEYVKADFYDTFKARTSTSLVLALTGSEIESGFANTIEFIMPSVYLKKVTPKVEGPDIVMGAVEFEAYANDTQPALQVRIVSSDSTL